jgi:hypothetical protein
MATAAPAIPAVPAVSSREPGLAFRLMVGMIAALVVGGLIGLGMGMGRLDDLRAGDEAEIEQRSDALQVREEAVYDRETAVGAREQAVSDREAALSR